MVYFVYYEGEMSNDGAGGRKRAFLYTPANDEANMASAAVTVFGSYNGAGGYIYGIERQRGSGIQR